MSPKENLTGISTLLLHTEKTEPEGKRGDWEEKGGPSLWSDRPPEDTAPVIKDDIRAGRGLPRKVDVSRCWRWAWYKYGEPSALGSSSCRSDRLHN